MASRVVLGKSEVQKCFGWDNADANANFPGFYDKIIVLDGLDIAKGLLIDSLSPAGGETLRDDGDAKPRRGKGFQVINNRTRSSTAAMQKGQRRTRGR